VKGSAGQPHLRSGDAGYKPPSIGFGRARIQESSR